MEGYRSLEGVEKWKAPLLEELLEGTHQALRVSGAWSFRLLCCSPRKSEYEFMPKKRVRKRDRKSECVHASKNKGQRENETERLRDQASKSEGQTKNRTEIEAARELGT
jgi:hypothetical protein